MIQLPGKLFVLPDGNSIGNMKLSSADITLDSVDEMIGEAFLKNW